MQIATTAIQFDMEGGHHDHFTGADDVGQRRVHFRVDVLEVDIHYRVPGFLEVDKRLIQHHAHHAQLGGRKLAPLDFGVTTVAAKKVVHQFEHQFGVENKQAGTAQRLHLRFQPSRHQRHATGHRFHPGKAGLAQPYTAPDYCNTRLVNNTCSTVTLPVSFSASSCTLAVACWRSISLPTGVIREAKS